MPRGLFFLFHVSLVIFNTHLIPAEPDVLPPEFWSNIDPAKADPRRNISCQGPLPRWIFPRVEGWDPNLEADVLSLCAAPQYGGAGKRSIDLPEPSYDPRRGAGFYCYGPIDSPSIGLPDLAVQATIFKLDNQARVLSLPELALFCRQRCFCNNFPRPMALRPKGVPDSQDVVQHFVAPEDARLVRQISIQETNFASIERRTKRTESPSIMTLITKIYKSYNRYQENEQGEMHSVPSTKLQIIDIWPKNKIVCIPGQVPSLPFPRPYNKEDFSSIMELCAVSLAGGHPDANAGAYCDPGGWYDVEPDIWFSDEYTPRFEWTWSSNWRFAALVRTFCWSKCRCKYAPMVRNRPADALFRATDVTAFKSLRYENVEMMVQRGDVPSQPFPNPNAPFTCSTGCIVSTLDVSQPFEPEPWPIDRFGPIPGTRPPLLSEPRLLSAEDDHSRHQCGRRCSGPASKTCDGGIGCECVAVPGGEPGRFAGLCLKAAKLSAQWLLQNRLRGIGAVCTRGKCAADAGLDRRGEERMVVTKCLCNETYAGSACCGSKDGIVWVHG